MEADADDSEIHRKTGTCADVNRISNLNIQGIGSMLVDDDFISSGGDPPRATIMIRDPDLVHFTFIDAMPNRGHHANVRIGAEQLSTGLEASLTLV